MPPITTFPAPPEPGNVYHADALEFLRQLPENYVDCIVTSPPYFGLRSYLPPDSPNKALEMGQEQTPAAYVANMVNVFREARRVLKPTGNFWLNVGDSYVGSTSQHKGAATQGHNSVIAPGTYAAVPQTGRRERVLGALKEGLKPKDLMLIPHRLAIALQDDGWWIRADNVWHKPNPMPESVTDRTTRAHEYVFHLTKSAHYYYDAEAIKEPAKNEGGGNFSKRYADAQPQHGGESHRKPYEMVNRRSVWTITPANYRDAHFATFPERLAEICILAGCPPGGLVLDMFFGAGTVGVVAVKTGRQYIGCELNPDYVTLARNRIASPQQVDMFSTFCTGDPAP